MRDTLRLFLAHFADRRSPRTVRTYGAILKSFAMLANVSSDGFSASPSRAIVEAFLARPRHDGARRSPATRNQELAALRAFARFALRDLGWTTNPTDGIPFARESPRDPAVLSVGELRRMFLAAAETASTSVRSRNLAILAVLSQTGLRVHEVVGLNVDQVDLTTGTLVAVKGKGGTIHDMPLNAPAVALLTAWMAERHGAAHDGEPSLFVSSRGTRLSVRAVERLVLLLRQAIGSAKKVTPHTFRHTAATLALTQGTDLATVAELLRHEDLNTTRRYVHLVDTRRREAVARLAVTVPAEILRSPVPSGSPLGIISKPTLAEFPQGRMAPDVKNLDVHCGLVALSPPCPRRSPPRMTTNTNTARAHESACCVPASRAKCHRLRARCDGRE